MGTREQWLEKAMALIAKQLFKPCGLKVPKVRVSIGFTGSRGGGKVIGSHWAPKASVDGVGQIYIVPTNDDSLKILEVLVHEMVHAAVGNEAGHGPVFRQAAESVGLKGPMRSTFAGEALVARLEKVVKALGDIPHRRLNPSLNPKKKQGTRLLKAKCEITDYTVRVTKTWVSVVGPPICPCCEVSMKVEMPEGEDE